MTDLVSELGPGTFALNGEFGERRLFTYLFLDGGKALLLDTGSGRTPGTVILPALDELGLQPEALKYVLVTHPDVDHQGGLAQILNAAPEAEPLCGFEDRAMVSDPERMLQQRYRAYVEQGLDFDREQLADIRANYGAPVEIRTTLLGGESIRLGNRELLVHHGPGHAAGHLMLEDPDLEALFISDAVHGRFSPAADGRPALPTTYEVVDDYLGTIDRVREIAPRSVYSGHFEPLHGSDVGRFLDLSQEFVCELDDFLLGAIGKEELTMGALCARAAEQFGPFIEPAFLFMFTLHGHLRRLARRGEIHVLLGPGSAAGFTLA